MEPNSPVVDADFYQKVAIAVTGGFVGAVLSTFLGFLRNNFEERRKLNRVKQLVFADLNKKREITDELIVEYEKLKKKFETRGLMNFYMKLFTNLTPDIFNTVKKEDLVKIFGREDAYKIDDIYTHLIYIKKYDIEYTYSKYLKWEREHKEEHKNDREHHEYWCDAHVQNVERAS